MRFSVPILQLLITIALALASPAQAQTQSYGTLAAHMKISRIDYHEEFHSQQASTRNIMAEQEALSTDGAVHIGRFSVSFNPDLETVEIISAHTEKADGRKILVQPDQINRQNGVLAPGTQISMPGVQVLQLTFPNVQKGDKTFVHYRQQMHKPALPNTLSNIGFLLNDLDIDSVKVQLSAPMALPLQVHAQGLALKTHDDGVRRHWSIEGSSKNFAADAQLANSLKVIPYWMYTTLPTRSALGDAFATAMREKLLVTPDIQSLAQQITAGKRSDFDKAQAIYQWIAKEIRYVAIFLGTGGFVPNALPDILRNRYGDCKDQTLLMMALLQALGIDAAPALINTANVDLRPPLAVAGLYNHVIVHIPALSLYADPTAASATPFGKLPLADAAKPVLVGLRQGAQEMQTPAFAAHDNRIEVKSVWRLDAQGHAKVDMQVKTGGQAATDLQDQLSQIPAGFSGAAVQRILKAANLKGQGFVQYAAIDRSQQEQDFSAQLQLSEILANPEGGSINPHPGIGSLPLYIGSVLGAQTDVNRRFDMVCIPISVEESFELHFPQNMQLLGLPKGGEHRGAGLSYSSRYQQVGNSVIGQRRFERLPTASGHMCTVDEVLQRHPVLSAIRRDLRGTVLYKAP